MVFVVVLMLVAIVVVVVFVVDNVNHFPIALDLPAMQISAGVKPTLDEKT